MKIISLATLIVTTFLHSYAFANFGPLMIQCSGYDKTMDGLIQIQALIDRPSRLSQVQGWDYWLGQARSTIETASVEAESVNEGLSLRKRFEASSEQRTNGVSLAGSVFIFSMKDQFSTWNAYHLVLPQQYEKRNGSFKAKLISEGVDSDTNFNPLDCALGYFSN